MQTKYTYKQIWLIAYPILISLLMEQMIGMTDTAFLGRVGEVELGASAIAGVFYMVIFMVAFGFSIGAQILIARRNGEQQYKEIGDLFYQGIYFQVGMATVMFLLSYCFSPIILKRIVASEHIYEAATSYLHWRVFGAFFSFSAVMFRAFFLGTTQTKTLTLNSIVMVLSNVVFNYILIFGKFGFPALGIAGAAIGSSLAELVSLLFFILYTRSRIDCCKYGLDRIPKFRLDVLKRMLNVSFWTMIQNFFSLSTWFLFFLYVEHLGERSLAVTNIVRNVSGILFMVLMAFASTCGSLVSNLIGAGKSTMLNAVAGVWPVDCGKIIIDGVDVTRLGEHQRAAYIGRVFQDPMTGTAATMQIEENLALAARRGKPRTLRIGITRAEREQYRELLKSLDLGLENRLTARVGLLSGGQRQALTLLMATMNKPKLLLLDEHTAALDPKTALKVLTLSAKIVEENHLTTMMITHNMKDAIKYGNRLIMMHEGHIIYDVSGEEKKNLQVSDLLAKFQIASGGEFANDRMILS